jgi:UDP-N-acetylmuramoylalanine--D-glutamate ligase
VAASIELGGKQVLVIGLARTGVATALFCAQRGAAVTAMDSRPESEMSDVIETLRLAKVTLKFGAPSEDVLLGKQLLIPSPGVPAEAPLLNLARQRNIPVWSEIELACRFLDGTLIGITGSNGKTTTTSLVEHILRHAGLATILAGNIGTPLVARVSESAEQTFTVAELSSFQLELIETFRPNISVLLNLTPDHLDRHKTFSAYAAAKARIFENQKEADCAVLNLDDAASLPFAPSRPQLFWFSRKTDVVQGAYVADGAIVFRRSGNEEVILRVGEIPLPGAHNLENVLAATVVARLSGVRSDKIATAIRSFAGVEHRLEFVAAIAGVRYYNDSKATNVDATIKALEAFPGRILIILGGKDKGSDYAPLIPLLREKAVQTLLIGAAAEKIESQIGGSLAVERAGNLQRAVEMASATAQPGDLVLLAPACASFDQFENYEQRGRVFKELVHQLENRAAGARNGGQ